MSSQKLRDLIRALRAAKTQAEERAVIQRECAAIRQDFNGRENPAMQARNMVKLMYISMLGYATEFGQMEVVKTIAKPEFAAKRVGYITLAVLMDETQEVLTLAENHLKQDLTNSNPFIQALALDVVANISGDDMARDVMSDVLFLMDSSNVQIQKKSRLAARRIVQKVPEYGESFLDKTLGCFNNQRSHGALICSISLMNEVLGHPGNAHLLGKAREQIPAAVRTLKGLVLSSYATEYDIGSIADPFLQVKILQFLRLVGKGSEVASEAMNDILAQVVTNTEAQKNVGCAILYECVRTIAAVHSDDGLRVLGVNILGRFVVNKDNNIRFVALGSLLEWLAREPMSVQRHRMTIIECLKDPDLSIRKKALRLTVALIDSSNVRVLVPDLLAYLAVCAEEIKAEACEKIAGVIEQKAPNAEWRIEVSQRFFKIGKSLVPESFALNFIALVTQQEPALQKAAVQGMYAEINQAFDANMNNRKAVLMAGLWVVGEYADYLGEGQDMQYVEDFSGVVATATLEASHNTVKLYGLTALAKIATKFPNMVIVANSVFETLAGSLDCEIQQRACEYMALLESFPDLAGFGLSRMPALIVETAAEDAMHDVDIGTGSKPASPVEGGGDKAAPAPKKAAPKDFMSSLFEDDKPSSGQQQPAAEAAAPKKNVLDIFDDDPAPTAPPARQQQAAPAGPPSSTFEVYRGPECAISITATPQSASDFTSVSCVASIQNLTGGTLTGVSMLVAVAKTCSVQIQPISASSIGPGASVTQAMTVNSQNDPMQGKLLMMKVKLLVTVNGEAKSHLFQVAHEF